MQKNPLIIIGMHRSGTSLLAQWLYRCGLHIGEELMAANGANEQGYFEDMDFVHLHEDLLTSVALPDSGLTDKDTPELSAFNKSAIIRLLERKDTVSVPWGWKDPRTCLFLPVYRQLVPHAKYLLIYRDFRFCVYSLIKRMLRDEKATYLKSGKRNAALRWKWYKRARIARMLFEKYTEDYLKIWIHYNNLLLAHAEALGREYCPVVNYLSLLSIDKKVFDFMTSRWNYQLSYIPFREVYSDKLMSKQAVIDPYIKDKSLIAAAESLESQLQAYALR